MKSAHKKAVFGKVIVYAILILIAVVMIIPFLWMLSASIKSDREVFQMNPFVWIPANPKWDNYVKIWTKIPFGRFVGNTVYLTLIVTFLQLLTSSFAAYSFANWTSVIRTDCSWHTSQPSQCPGRYTWYLSSS